MGVREGPASLPAYLPQKLSLEQRTERLVQRRWESSPASSAPPDPQAPPGGPSLLPRSLSVVPDSKRSPDPQIPPQTSKRLPIPSLAPVIPRNASGTPSYPTRTQVTPQTPHSAHKSVPRPLKLRPRPLVPRGQQRASISPLPNLLLPSPARPCSGRAPAGQKGRSRCLAPPPAAPPSMTPSSNGA